MNQTTVISVRGQSRAKLLEDPDFLYVGRGMPRQGWKRSIWCNPYRVAKKRFRTDDDHCCATAAIAIERFERRIKVLLRDFPDQFRLADLRGKKLACWCGNWSPGEPEIECHAVILAKLANASVEF